MELNSHAVMNGLILIVGIASFCALLWIMSKLRYCSLHAITSIPFKLGKWTVRFWTWLRGSDSKSNSVFSTLTIILLAVSLINIGVMMIGVDKVRYHFTTVKEAMAEVSLPSLFKNCQIKGNIGWNGDKIYHTPQSPYYHKTQINWKRGERWFCTIEEAEAAGWRAPYR